MTRLRAGTSEYIWTLLQRTTLTSETTGSISSSMS